MLLKLDPSTKGDYHVTFLSRHPDDNHFCDDVIRWWPEWYEYLLNDDNIPVYGSRILFTPNHKPNLAKYMLWTFFTRLKEFSCQLFFSSREYLSSLDLFLCKVFVFSEPRLFYQYDYYSFRNHTIFRNINITSSLCSPLHTTSCIVFYPSGNFTTRIEFIASMVLVCDIYILYLLLVFIEFGIRIWYFDLLSEFGIRF